MMSSKAMSEVQVIYAYATAVLAQCHLAASQSSASHVPCLVHLCPLYIAQHSFSFYAQMCHALTILLRLRGPSTTNTDIACSNAPRLCPSRLTTLLRALPHQAREPASNDIWPLWPSLTPTSESEEEQKQVRSDECQTPLRPGQDVVKERGRGLAVHSGSRHGDWFGGGVWERI